MPNSIAPSIAVTASTSRVSRTSGVQLTPSESEGSISSGAPIAYTPSTASEISRTPTASIISASPTTSSSLNNVFLRLATEDRRKALRSLQNSVLGEALGCQSKEVASLIVTASTDELWAFFCQLNIEQKRRTLESIKRASLKKAFREESGEDGGSMNTASYAVAPFEVTTNTLTSAFKKLSVADQEKALAAVQFEKAEKKGLRRGANGWGLDDPGVIEDHEETLLEHKPDLAEWQELCRACGIQVEEIPTSITKCKETKNVALSDLTDAIRNGTVAQTFPSLSQLRKYVQSNKKVANKAATKAESRFLKKMLRELFRYRQN